MTEDERVLSKLEPAATASFKLLDITSDALATLSSAGACAPSEAA